MDRRTFLGSTAASLLIPPVSARAQLPAKVYRLGILEAIPAAQNAANLAALRKGLRELGYVEGRNLIIEYRSADEQFDRLPALAAELVERRVSVIAALGGP